MSISWQPSLGAITLASSSSIALLLSYLSLKQDRATILPWSIIGFVVLDSLGLILLPFLGLNLPYLSDVYVVYESLHSTTTSIYMRHIIAHLLVQVGFIAILLLAMSRTRTPTGKSKVHCPLRFSLNPFGKIFVIPTCLVGLGFYFKYFLFGPGLSLLFNAQLFFSSPEEAVAARSLAWAQVEPGQGAFGASIASYSIFPFIVALVSLLMKEKSRAPFIMFGGIFFLLSAAYAIQTYQKAPLAYVALMYGSILALGIRPNESTAFTIKRTRHKTQITPIIFFLAAGTILGVALYVINFGLSLADSVASFFARLLLVPANTESYWFLVFPEMVDFLGIWYAFNTSMDIIHTTAYLATGDVFSANASFVAVGWSGMGFWGVLLSGALVATYLMLVEFLAQKAPPQVKRMAMFASLPPLVFLVSGTFFDFAFKGGLVPLLLLVTVSAKRTESTLSLPSSLRRTA